MFTLLLIVLLAILCICLLGTIFVFVFKLAWGVVKIAGLLLLILAVPLLIIGVVTTSFALLAIPVCLLGGFLVACLV